LRTKAKFCAIPSTSGTATEVTAFSVITDYAKGIKYPLADFNITPDVAIIDPNLALTMPPKLTDHTGMDAITHAIEAYVSTLHCDYTDTLALHAIIAELAVGDACTGSIPRKITPAEMEKLLHCCFYDTEVDF
jgi:alcohol dehydrogenase class IV